MPSKYATELPATDIPRFNEVLNDPALLSLRHEISLLDLRIEALLHQINQSAPTPHPQKLHGALKAYQQALTAKDLTLQANRLNDLVNVINNTTAPTFLWANLHALIEQRCRLIQTEQRNVSQKSSYIPSENIVNFGRHLLALLLPHAINNEARTQIESHITLCLGRYLGHQPGLQSLSDEPQSSLQNE